MRFKKAYVEITNECNLSCEFCSPVLRKKRYMTVSEFSFIAEQLKEYTKYIYLHVKGEPLLHPQLDEILKISDEFGFCVTITTNGTLIEKRKDVLLSNNIYKMNISLHSLITLQQAEQYIDNIFNLIEDKRKKTIFVLRQWVDNCEIGEYIRHKITEKYNLPEEKHISLKENLNTTIDKNIYFSHESEFAWPQMTNPFVSESGFCYGLRDQIAILADGTVVPCCLDCNGVIALGNIYENSIRDILCSQRAKNIYNGFTARTCSELLCKHCSYRTRFNK